MTDTIARLREAIEAAVTPILAEDRSQLLGDWLCIISTMGTEPGDAGSYVWLGTAGIPPHARIGLAAILHDDTLHEDTDEDD